MTYICVSKLTIIDSDNYLKPCWSIFNWTLATNFNEHLIVTKTFSFMNMYLKIWSGKCWPFCVGLNVLKYILNLFLFTAAIGYWKPNITSHVYIYLWFSCARLEWVNWDDSDCPFIYQKTMSQPPAESWVDWTPYWDWYWPNFPWPCSLVLTQLSTSHQRIRRRESREYDVIWGDSSNHAVTAMRPVWTSLQVLVKVSSEYTVLSGMYYN